MSASAPVSSNHLHSKVQQQHHWQSGNDVIQQQEISVGINKCTWKKVLQG